MKTKKARFIVFEGIDGCGKSTQAELLAEYLKKKGQAVELTREHTRDLPAGKLIEEMVNRRCTLAGKAQQLLYVVDRIDHTEKVVKPALDSGKTVISDRYWWSTVAYSNLNDQKEYFLRIQKGVVLEPDIVVWVDLRPKVALERMNGRAKQLTIFEKQKKLRKIRKGYRWLKEKYPEQCLVVDGSKSITEIHQKIVSIMEKRGLI